MKLKLAMPELILGLLFPSLFAQAVYNLPQVANGTGIITTFVFFNNTNNDATVVLSLRDDNGDPFAVNLEGLGQNSIHIISIPAAQTRFIRSDGAGPLRAGSAQVTSTVDIGVSAIFSLVNGENIITEAGIGASQAVRQFAISVDTTAPFNTGLALQNLSGAPNPVTFELIESTGTSATSAQGAARQAQRTLPGNGHLAVFVGGVGGLFPDIADFRGKLTVTASSDVAALTLRQAISGTPLTTLPVVASNSTQTSFVLPQVANGQGIKTQFVFFALGATAGNITAVLTDDNGDPFPVNLSDGQSGSTLQFQIPGNGSILIETDGMGALVAGAARITSTVPLGVSAIFSLIDGQGNSTTEAGVGDSPAFTRFSLPVDLTGGFNTGVAFFNNNTTAAAIQARFIDQNGQNRATSSLQLAPGEAAELSPQGNIDALGPREHIARFVTELFDGLAATQGQLAITSSVPLTAITLRQGPTTLTTLPVREGVADGGGPAMSTLLPATVTNVNLSAGATLNRSLSEGFLLTGRITAPAGFLALGGVIAAGANGTTFSGSSDFFGNYTVTVPPGTFDLRVCLIGLEGLPAAVLTLGSADSFSAQFLEHVEAGIVVNGNTQRNITVPAVTTFPVQGTLGNLGELPSGALANTAVIAFSSETSATTAVTSLNENGALETRLAAGTYTASVFFGIGEDLDGDAFPDEFSEASALFDIGTVTVNGSTTANLTLPDIVEVSGNLDLPGTAAQGNGTGVFALDNSRPLESFLEQCFPAFGAGFGTASVDGVYRVFVLANRSYGVFASVRVLAIGTNEEGIWSTPIPANANRTFTADTVVNFSFPALPTIVTLSGTVTSGGVPVAGVEVDLVSIGGVSGAPNTSFSVGTLTDDSGRYSVQVLSGTGYTVTFTPPSSR